MPAPSRSLTQPRALALSLPLALALATFGLGAVAWAADPPECDGSSPAATPTGNADDTCVRDTPVGTFSPEIKWQWTTNTIDSGYDDIMTTPMVGNLTDDNGDGLIDADDTPDIIFTAFSGGAYSSAGRLVAISGDDGSEIFSIASAGGVTIPASGGVAIGDLEGDAIPDICVAGYNATLLCMENDGTYKWSVSGSASIYGFPAIADMDGDGQSEVIFGASVYDTDGTLLGTGAYGTGGYGNGYRSAAVDWDGDGQLEVVAGNAVYEVDGTAIMTTSGYDGPVAVGDFDEDGLPDLVTAYYGVVYVYLNDGSLYFSTVADSSTTGGGAPTVADFDGDGLGIATKYYYTVIDDDGSLLWQASIHDYSSQVTSSSVFDFDGDGAAEVLMADENDLFVFDGSTGTVKYDFTDHASGTLFEYPVIADVDKDGAADIILASNDYAFSGTNGITVLSDSSWQPARPVWNQFTYHITNVENDLSIPAGEEDNWLSWNNFRAGGTVLGPSDWLVDLGVGSDLSGDGTDTSPATCVSNCAPEQVDVWVPVTNNGLVTASGYTLTFSWDDGTVVDSVVETVDIASGEGTVLGPYTFVQADWGTGDLWVTLSDPASTDECDSTDNRIDLGAWPITYEDLDGDGSVGGVCPEDCDDSNADAFPGNSETWYDGVDEACDGGSDYDADGDGYDSDAYGGTDCDDSDDSVYPGAYDDPYDAVDADCDGVNDSDGDGLSDGEELDLGTDPTNPDTDGDGLSDGDEVMVYGTDPLLADTDGDGCGDGDELAAGTDPLLADTDGDGVGDCDELAAGTDPLDSDSDDDGLSDGDEASWGTDPLLADTDGDGLTDGDEVSVYETDPLDSDTDDDGLSDGDEVNTTDTDPNDADTDDDGLSDGDEVNTYDTDPNDADTDDGGKSDG
ncbi:MAG: VCBS repeat-containing protein, partial [Oligoflexia bacterium]|nr:VCBS repeat-containing protein [Oligoflexia bacterium]